MKIAVTYENGEVFQHFGHSEHFKIYDVTDGVVSASVVRDTEGSGHEALAQLLAEYSVDTLICGGIGSGALDALAEEGITVVAGASGDADAAVAAYLAGDLISSGEVCSHHDHEEGHSCGGNCGGCHGHCGMPMVEGPNAGRTVRVHYRGTFNDGTQFDASYDRGEPLEFVCGSGMMIPGFDAAVALMNLGEAVDIHLMPEDAYGPSDPRMIFTVEVGQLPGSEELEAGQQVYLYDTNGQPIKVTVVSREGGNITFDANHEMAGKELNFHIELVEIL